MRTNFEDRIEIAKRKEGEKTKVVAVGGQIRMSKIA
jgi:hypothetical protein